LAIVSSRCRTRCSHFVARFSTSLSVSSSICSLHSCDSSLSTFQSAFIWQVSYSSFKN
jgi:hypothetical protein